MKPRREISRTSAVGRGPRHVAALAFALLALVGCVFRKTEFRAQDAGLERFEAMALDIEQPDAETPGNLEAAATPAPITIESGQPPQFRDLTLAEAIRIALENNEVVRDISDVLVSRPESATTIFDPAVALTNPESGIDAALSAFDAQLQASATFEKIDHPINGALFTRQQFKQDLAAFRTEISKRAAAGTLLTMRHNVDYDFNNTPGNPFVSTWQSSVEGEFRQPLLQGFGTEFNRIAGPGATPGRYRGVLLARIDADVSLVDFEIAVRNLVSDVENAYWELYFAYRQLDSALQSREQALETWRRIHALFQSGRRGGEAEKEAQAREQYFAREAAVQNALTGQFRQRTSNNVFQSNGAGIYASERRLRLMLGMTINDGHIFRPTDEPLLTKVTFDWGQVLAEALMRRQELRQMRWTIKRQELELVAARNFLKPQLEAFGRYRWRGFGEGLIDANRQPVRFDNAYQDLTTGDFQEWLLGAEMTLPIGFRQAHAAVRNSELLLARAHALEREAEREVTHDLSTQFNEITRALAVAQTNYNRRFAAQQQVKALEAVYEDADENEKARYLDLLLDAQGRVATAETAYYESLVFYTLAIKHMHFLKGSLLDYCEIQLSEGPWPEKAYHDAAKRARLRSAPLALNNFILRSRAPVVSAGSYPQQTAPATATFEYGPALPAPAAVLPAVELPPPAPAEELPPVPPM